MRPSPPKLTFIHENHGISIASHTDFLNVQKTVQKVSPLRDTSSSFWYRSPEVKGCKRSWSRTTWNCWQQNPNDEIECYYFSTVSTSSETILSCWLSCLTSRISKSRSGFYLRVQDHQNTVFYTGKEIIILKCILDVFKICGCFLQHKIVAISSEHSNKILGN